MSDLNHLVAESSRCYQAMVQWLDAHDGQLPAMSQDQVAEMIAQFKNLQERVEEADRRLAALLEDADPDHLDQNLWHDRSRLIASVQEKNRSFSREIQARQAVIGADLAHLRKGQAALGGYRGGAPARGGRIGGNY